MNAKWQKILRQDNGASVAMWVILATLLLSTVIAIAISNMSSNPTVGDYTKYLGNTNRVLSVKDVTEAQNKFANNGNLKSSWKPSQTVIGDQYLGSPDAKVKVVQYEDFACSSCTGLESSAEKIHSDYANKSVVFIYRNFSIGQSTSTISEAAAQAAYIASGNEMNTFWSYVKKVFTGQACIEGSDKTTCQDALVQYAKDLGINTGKFNDLLANFANNGIQDKLNRDKNMGSALGINATPTWIVSNAKSSKTVTGADESSMRSAIDAALK